MNNLLSEDKIRSYAKNSYLITIADSVTSTNTILKKQARVGAPHGTVLIAKEQTDGRGRSGKSFYSPKASGLYMSVVLRINCDMNFSQLITPAAAVAVVRALKAQGVQNPGIKWVNDIYCDEKKVCGILTEVEFLPSSATPAFFIVGIGINLNTQNFPGDIKDIAGCAFKNSDFDINMLCAQILDNLFFLCESANPQSFSDEYKNLSILTGRDVTLISGDKSTPVRVMGIDDSLRLIVKLPDNSILHINTGEVSIKF